MDATYLFRLLEVFMTIGVLLSLIVAFLIIWTADDTSEMD